MTAEDLTQCFPNLSICLESSVHQWQRLVIKPW